MEAKSVLYAAVGAPLVAARKVGDQVESLKGKFSKEKASYTKAAEKAITDWAVEGEKVVNRFSEGKVVEEITSKVDLDQAKTQVGKLRDQLEDMLSTWRRSFRPEKDAEEKAKPAPAKKPTAKKPAAKAPAKKPAAKSSATTATKSSTAAKKSPAKSSTATKAKSTS